MNDEPLSGGDFSAWMTQVERAIRGEGASDVPCGSCTACCTASQFVHIGPDEMDTLSHIDPSLVFPAPGLPRGHVVLGYDERGHCPMLIDNQCSIYEHRPANLSNLRLSGLCRCRVAPARAREGRHRRTGHALGVPLPDRSGPHAACSGPSRSRVPSAAIRRVA